MSPHAILFDFDGTLVDTNDAHVEAWAEAFASLDLAVPECRIRREIGKGGDHLVPDLVGEDRERRLGDRLRAAHDSAFRRIAERSPFQLFPGAADLLDTLRRRCLTTAIVTSSDRAMIETVEKRLAIRISQRVDFLITAADAASSKPEPDLLFAALDKIKLPGNHCAFLGDTVHDAEAATRAGVPFIGLTCGGCATEAELALAGAVSVWRDPADVLVHLDQILALRLLAFAD